MSSIGFFWEYNAYQYFFCLCIKAIFFLSLSPVIFSIDHFPSAITPRVHFHSWDFFCFCLFFKNKKSRTHSWRHERLPLRTRNSWLSLINAVRVPVHGIKMNHYWQTCILVPSQHLEFVFFWGGGEIELGSKPLSNNRHTWPHLHHGRNPVGDQTHEPEDEASQESDSLKNKKHVNT